MEDRRTHKTKQNIKKAFFTLLKQKPLNKITVVDLSRMADLGRGTFYLHYKDIYDLYDHIEKEFFTELGQFFDSSPLSCEPGSLSNLIDIIPQYIVDNKERFLILFFSNKTEGNLQKFKDFLIEKFLTTQDFKSLSDLNFFETLFAISGCIGILEQWLKDDLTTPPIQISSMLHDLLFKLISS